MLPSQKKTFVPARYLTTLSYPDEAEPAYQTMDGWKEIRRCIRCIDKTHQPAAEIMSCHFRSDIRGWKQYKEDTAGLLLTTYPLLQNGKMFPLSSLDTRI